MYFWVRCFGLYVPLAISTEEAYNEKHTCKSAPASSQSGFIPVTHKGPFLCHSLADPGRMCVATGQEN